MNKQRSPETTKSPFEKAISAAGVAFIGLLALKGAGDILRPQ